jgi:hypothetical protein
MDRVDHREADRRTRVRPLFYPERRTGFDPRRRSPVLGFLRDSRWLLLGLLIALNMLSLADWVLTLTGIGAGATTEGNPVLAGLMGQSLPLAGAFKLVVMLGVSIIVWRGREFRLVLATLVAGVGLYFAVFVYHLVGLTATGVL